MLNHWTTREVPQLSLKMVILCTLTHIYTQNVFFGCKRTIEEEEWELKKKKKKESQKVMCCMIPFTELQKWGTD